MSKSRIVAQVCLHGCRLFVPFVFGLAAVGKYLTWAAYVSAASKIVGKLGLPGDAQHVFVAILPAVECAVAVIMVMGRGRWFQVGAWAAFALSLGLAATRARLAVAGIVFHCPCFGQLVPTDRLDGLGGAIVALTCVASTSLVVFGDPLDYPAFLKGMFGRRSVEGPPRSLSSRVKEGSS